MKLRKLVSLTSSPEQTDPSTAPSLVGMPRLRVLRDLSPETSSSPAIPRLSRLPEPRRWRVLDFDIETLAAGFADPDWVPQKITIAAWSWLGSKEVFSVSTGKAGFFDRRLRVKALAPLVDAILEADVLTGHNIMRFDLPVLNAELIRAGQAGLPSLWVQDTIRFPKAKGLKKSQDDLSVMTGTGQKKLTMNWEQWDRAYEERGWPVPLKRCETDVTAHKKLYKALSDQGVLDRPRRWKARKP